MGDGVVRRRQRGGGRRDRVMRRQDDLMAVTMKHASPSTWKEATYSTDVRKVWGLGVHTLQEYTCRLLHVGRSIQAVSI